MEDLAFADGVRDFFFGNDFLFGEDFHGIDAFGVLFADLENLAKGAASDELEEFKVSWCEGAFRLEMGVGHAGGRRVKKNKKIGTLYCSYVTWTRISPLTTSSSNGRNLGEIDDQDRNTWKRGKKNTDLYH